MKIGISLGCVLGVILLIIGSIGFLLSKKKQEKCKWCPWVVLAGVCALITAGVNAFYFLAL
ncbi:MAG: hypothetical protein RR967_03380 [Anaerovoracaceae bacterium]